MNFMLPFLAMLSSWHELEKLRLMNIIIFHFYDFHLLEEEKNQ